MLAGLFAISSHGDASAQYGGSGAAGGQVTQEQLARCEELGIERSQCTDVNILARERLTAAQENPSSGSGTPMLSTETGQMAVFIGILGAIFGGVAAIFFFKGRGSKPITR
ncbi:hypothetical protein Ngar_c32500 [Candidatus Nitrososphaera gargensis Ga9.2]|uniref:Uncharacterized protein n=2 Tax=Candidatus Nitrososphaera gargensis TaxID=497727 RepID=K0IFM5_NITGG|nr:hypothetical protein Ngar_c32500 [Candidatus Nitrososphaera gargensis Ga9.2]